MEFLAGKAIGPQASISSLSDAGPEVGPGSEPAAKKAKEVAEKEGFQLGDISSVLRLFMLYVSSQNTRVFGTHRIGFK